MKKNFLNLSIALTLCIFATISVFADEINENETILIATSSGGGVHIADRARLEQKTDKDYPSRPTVINNTRNLQRLEHYKMLNEKKTTTSNNLKNLKRTTQAQSSLQNINKNSNKVQQLTKNKKKAVQKTIQTPTNKVQQAQIKNRSLNKSTSQVFINTNKINEAHTLEINEYGVKLK